MGEKWKKVKDFEDYEVSDCGRVRSLKYGKKRIMSPGKCWGDHRSVSLRNRDGERRFRVHRLVAEAFVANDENYPIVRHINGIPYDNRAENLCWGTQKDNVEDSIKAGTHVFNRRPMDEHVYRLGNEAHRTPIKATNLSTGKSLSFSSQREASTALNINTTSINQVLKGSRKTAGGYKFDYIPKVKTGGDVSGMPRPRMFR